MVTKSNKENAGKKKQIKVLNLKKETVKNLTDDESKRVKGGTTQCLIGSRVPQPGSRSFIKLDSVDTTE